MKRLLNAIKVGYWAFKNPRVLQIDNMKMLSELWNLIIKVSSEHHPMMTQVAYVHPTEGEMAIVSIWAGASMKADPVERIRELQSEISLLKIQLSKQIK